MEEKNDFKKLPNEELEEVAGGGIKEQFLAGALGISTLIGGATGVAAKATDHVNTNISTSESKNNENYNDVFGNGSEKYLQGITPENVNHKLTEIMQEYEALTNGKVSDFQPDKTDDNLTTYTKYLIIKRLIHNINRNKIVLNWLKAETKIFTPRLPLTIRNLSQNIHGGAIHPGITAYLGASDFSICFDANKILDTCKTIAHIVASGKIAVTQVAEGKSFLFSIVDHEFAHLTDFIENMTNKDAKFVTFTSLNSGIARLQYNSTLIKSRLENILKDLGLSTLPEAPSKYAETNNAEFVAESGSNSKATIFSEIKSKFGINMRTKENFNDLKKIAGNNKNSKIAKTAREFLKKLQNPKHAWGLAYRILEAEEKIRLPKN